MMSNRKHRDTPWFGPLVHGLLGFLLTVAATSVVQAQTDAIYGVTTVDVAPSAASQGVALLRQYRDGARKQAGNLGVTLLQEVDWPNRFVIYEEWKDHAAYDANEKAAHTAEFRDKLKPMPGRPGIGASTASSRSDRRAPRQAPTPSTCSCISTCSRPASMPRSRPPGRWPRRPQGRRQSPLRRRGIRQAAAEPLDVDCRLAEPQGVRCL